MEGLLTCGILGLNPQSFWFNISGVGPDNCIYNKLPSEADAGV